MNQGNSQYKSTCYQAQGNQNIGMSGTNQGKGVSSQGMDMVTQGMNLMTQGMTMAAQGMTMALQGMGNQMPMMIPPMAFPMPPMMMAPVMPPVPPMMMSNSSQMRAQQGNGSHQGQTSQFNTDSKSGTNTFTESQSPVYIPGSSPSF